MAKSVKAELVKVSVLKRFRDKNDHKTWYEVDEVLEFEALRAQDVVDRGLAKFSDSDPKND